MRWFVLLVAGVASCGIDTGFDTPPAGPSLPVRVRLISDAQYTNAVRDLLGDLQLPALHSPGTTPNQFIYEDMLAVDAPQLVQYRIAAETAAAQIAADPSRLGCGIGDDACLRDQIDVVAARAFRRPIDAVEHDQLAALYAQGAASGGTAAGAALVVEAVLQAPSFVYLTEVGPPPGAAPGAVAELTPYELAAELAALLLDSVPDEPLWQAARDGSLADPAELASQVDRLLGTQRVRSHLIDVVLDWLGVPGIFTVTKDATRFPELTPELRAHFGVPDDAGVMVAKVEPGSPAEKAGIKVGDILTRVDGGAIKSSWDVTAKIRKLDDGQQVPVEIWRNGKAQNVTATIVEKERPEIDMGPLLLKDGEGPMMLHMNPDEWKGMAQKFKVMEDGGLGKDVQIRRMVSPREVELEKKLKALEKRIDELEKQLKKQK